MVDHAHHNVLFHSATTNDSQCENPWPSLKIRTKYFTSSEPLIKSLELSPTIREDDKCSMQPYCL